MNTFEFFREHFGRHLVQPTNQAHVDAWKVLSSTYSVQNAQGKVVKSRLSSGWAIVRPGYSSTQINLMNKEILVSDMTRFEAFARELQEWDGEPRIFITFDKAPLPIAHLFMTVDLRSVRVCTPGGVETFDFLHPHPPEAQMKYERNITKWITKNAA
jgi:hypothetical protein